MRLYGGRPINSKIKREVVAGRELRDAIVWEVNSTEHYCLVKIQGSDQTIKAWFNENFETQPQWMRPGNAVRLTHPGGNKGKIQVVSHGFLLPTAVTGGTQSPPYPDPGNGVISGMTVSGGFGGMSVSVSSGSYRISDEIYYAGILSMPAAHVEMPGPEVLMGGTSQVVLLDVGVADKYRYDLIVAGTDGIAHEVKGNAYTGEPVMPETPADHVLLNFVLIVPGMTIILPGDIGRLFTSLLGSSFEITPSSQTLTYLSVIPPRDEEVGFDYCYVDIRFLNQYGDDVPGPTAFYVAHDYGENSIGHKDGSSPMPTSFSGTLRLRVDRIMSYPLGEDKSSTFRIVETSTGKSISGSFKVINKDALGNDVYV